MNDLDQELLKLLQKYGFQSSRLLASHLGISQRTIHRHLKKMQDDHIFRVIATPDFVSFGYKAWAKIGIKVDPNTLNYVAQTLANHPSVYFVAYSLGTYDIVIAVTLPNLNMLEYFVNYEMSKIEGITSKETILLVRPLKYYRHRWPEFLLKPVHDITENDIIQVNEKYQTSDLDLKILNILRENGLANPAMIKQKLGVSEGLVRKRIKYMKDSKLITFEVVPNKEVLEDEAWATIGVNTRYGFDDKMLDSIINDSDVYLVSICLGRFDLVLAVRFKNIDFLTEFISKKLISLKGINSVQTFIHNKPLKYHNIRLSEY